MPSRSPTRLASSPTRQTTFHTRFGRAVTRDGVTLCQGDVLDLYDRWDSPICIVVDGPYGLGSFPGDPPTHDGLAELYRPHVEAWSRRSTPETTLWFWNSEVGWATVHPVLVANGWEYRCAHVWNKGLGHVAGNANSLTLRKFPVVTEVCVQYIKPARFPVEGRELSMKDWLRREWMRSGLPMYLSNRACGVKNAATRKYLTADHLWYYPPVEAFTAMAKYVNEHGDQRGRPYFSLDGKQSVPGEQWAKLRAKFYCEVGINNVWTEPPVRGSERLRSTGIKVLHMNQKPLRLIDIAIRASTDEGDAVWEPFGGLCSVAVSSHRLRRRCASAEINPEFFAAAARRLVSYDKGLCCFLPSHGPIAGFYPTAAPFLAALHLFSISRRCALEPLPSTPRPNLRNFLQDSVGRAQIAEP